MGMQVTTPILYYSNGVIEVACEVRPIDISFSLDEVKALILAF